MFPRGSFLPLFHYDSFQDLYLMYARVAPDSPSVAHQAAEINVVLISPDLAPSEAGNLFVME